MNKAIAFLSDELPDDALSLLDWFEQHCIGRVRNKQISTRVPPET